jgi:glycerol kinase
MTTGQLNMTEKKYIVALDQGTTSSRAVVMDHDANIISVSQREFEQIYPKPGWVEHDPMEIWATQSSTLVEVLAKADISSDQIAAIGITNQRETTIVWEKETGKPIYNAIVWQCRRTAEICEHLKRDGLEDYIRSNTGLNKIFIIYRTENTFVPCAGTTTVNASFPLCKTSPLHSSVNS